MAHSAISGTVPLHSPATAGPARPPGAGTSASAAPAREPRRVPLHLVAAFGLTVLLFVIVSALSAQTYLGMQDVLRTVAYDETRFIREALAEKVQRILEPAESQLALLAYSDLPAATTLPQRLGELPLVL